MMRLLLSMGLVGGFCLAVLAEPPPESSPPPSKAELERQIAQLVSDLDAPQFAVRRRAEAKLLELGPPTLSALLAAERSRSAEVRTRAHRIARVIDDREIGRAFDRLGRMKIDADIDIEEALWLLSRTVDPIASRNDVTRGLDQLAADVRKELGEVEPKRADPAKVLAALREVLHTRGGLTSSMQENDAPAGSSALRILQTKRGQPLVIAQMVVAIGRRLELPLVSVDIPGSSMVKYDGRQRPKAFAGGDLILDPGRGFRIFPKIEELVALLQDDGIELEPQVHLAPLSPRAAVSRMLFQLSEAFSQAGQDEKQAQVLGYLRMIDRTGSGEYLVEP